MSYKDEYHAQSNNDDSSDSSDGLNSLPYSNQKYSLDLYNTTGGKDHVENQPKSQYKYYLQAPTASMKNATLNSLNNQRHKSK